MIIDDIKAALHARRDDIRDWLTMEAPYAECDQTHLDANSPERAYWHLGYQSAINDILRLIERHSNQTDSTGGKPN